jgi:hypothetical protein
MKTIERSAAAGSQTRMATVPVVGTAGSAAAAGVSVGVGAALAMDMGVSEGTSVVVGVEGTTGPVVGVPVAGLASVGARVGAGALKWNWARARLVPARQAASTAIVTTSPALPTTLKLPVSVPSRPT